MEEHRIITKEDIKKVEDFIVKATKFLREEEDKDNIQFYLDTLEISKAAQKAAADNNEKWTYLYSAITQWAHKLMFRLFEYDLTTEELVADFRALERQEVTGRLVQDYIDERAAAEEEVRAKALPLQEAKQGLNVFIGVLSGKTLEEAKQAQNEYNQKVAEAAMEAQAQAASQGQA